MRGLKECMRNRDSRQHASAMDLLGYQTLMPFSIRAHVTPIYRAYNRFGDDVFEMYDIPKKKKGQFYRFIDEANKYDAEISRYEREAMDLVRPETMMKLIRLQRKYIRVVDTLIDWSTNKENVDVLKTSIVGLCNQTMDNSCALFSQIEKHDLDNELWRAYFKFNDMFALSGNSLSLLSMTRYYPKNYNDKEVMYRNIRERYNRINVETEAKNIHDIWYDLVRMPYFVN